MTEAGQIFALLRTNSAAEIAKRFNMPDDGAGQRPLVAEPAPGPGGTTGTPGKPAAPGTTQATGAPVPTGATGSLPDASGADPAAGPSLGLLRAAVSLGHLAPPRSDLVRMLADTLVSGTSRLGSASGSAVGTVGGTGGQAAGGSAATGGTVLSGAGMVAGSGPAAAAVAGLATAGFVAGGASIGTLADVGSATASVSPLLGVAGGNSPAPLPGTGAGGAAPPATASLRTPDAQQARTAEGAALAGQSVSEADTAAASLGTLRGMAETGGPAAARLTLSPTQLAAFADAMAAALDPAAAGKTGTVASGIIFNAAMMPGWPFPSAMARDVAEAINAKAMLHRLAAAVEGMTPQQAAEYMAKIGGGHAFLRNLRRILKELDLTDKDEVKGLLFAFLETLSAIASGIQTAFKQLNESAALQAAVVHGEEPEDGDRPGRRRLRL